MEYTDILYEVKDRVATITINRPKVLNAFRARTCEELIHAFQEAGWDREVGAIVLTGAGERAFCTGGDQGDHDGAYAGGKGAVGMPVREMHTAIRDAAKPVIAKVRGYAIGGGNVLATICDLTLAAESAVFGQVGPKMGSVDPGFGTAYLARVVGEKKAREMWFLCRRYSAAEALAMGLVNAVFPDAELDARERGDGGGEGGVGEVATGGGGRFRGRRGGPDRVGARSRDQGRVGRGDLGHDRVRIPRGRPARFRDPEPVAPGEAQRRRRAVR